MRFKYYLFAIALLLLMSIILAIPDKSNIRYNGSLQTEQEALVLKVGSNTGKVTWHKSFKEDIEKHPTTWTATKDKSKMTITPNDGVKFNFSGDKGECEITYTKPGEYLIKVEINYKADRTTEPKYDDVLMTNTFRVKAVVELKELKYIDLDGKEKVVPKPFYVGSGSTVKFKAYSTFENYWPKDKPVWGGAADGIGAEKSVTFNVAAGNTSAEENKQISVECGKKIEATIIVCPVPYVTSTLGDDYKVTANITAAAKAIRARTEAEITQALGEPPFGTTGSANGEQTKFAATPNFQITKVISGYNVIKFEGKSSFTNWPPLNLVVTMPEWVNKDNSKDEELKKKWDKFYNNLKIHEDGHVKLYEEFVSKMAKIENNAILKGYAKNQDDALDLMIKEIDEKLDKISGELDLDGTVLINGEMEDAQEQYDKNTEDGKTQGAV